MRRSFKYNQTEIAICIKHQSKNQIVTRNQLEQLHTILAAEVEVMKTEEDVSEQILDNSFVDEPPSMEMIPSYISDVSRIVYITNNFRHRIN